MDEVDAVFERVYGISCSGLWGDGWGDSIVSCLVGDF